MRANGNPNLENEMKLTGRMKHLLDISYLHPPFIVTELLGEKTNLTQKLPSNAQWK
jgi:hypothetical protein